MIFLRYESFRQYLRLYPVTAFFLLINLLVFLSMTITGLGRGYALNGSRYNDILVQYGAMVNAPPYSSQLWRYLSSMFVHIGWEHLLFNCFAIFIFAPPMELLLGRTRYFLLYLGSGLTGNIFSELLMQSVHLAAGASGAIFGIYGGFMFLALFRKAVLDQSSSRTITLIFVIGLIYSFIVPHVNIYAHIGGFIGGFALFWLLARGRRFHGGYRKS